MSPPRLPRLKDRRDGLQSGADAQSVRANDAVFKSKIVNASRLSCMATVQIQVNCRRGQHAARQVEMERPMTGSTLTRRALVATGATGVLTGLCTHSRALRSRRRR